MAWLSHDIYDYGLEQNIWSEGNDDRGTGQSGLFLKLMVLLNSSAIITIWYYLEFGTNI